MTRPHVTRRELVAGAAATTGLLAGVPDAWAQGLLRKRPRIGPGTFADGVASGEPTARAVTFWSKLMTDRQRSGARLLVARDPGMRKVVASAVVPTGRGVDGTLKTRVGGLDPATEYFYAWESGSDVSPVGRTRTAPAPGSADALRIGFSSCQNYAIGFYAAHAHAAAQPLDVYLFLGDYIYETRKVEVRTDELDAVDLSSYRRKYRQYRTDAGLRELHRLHPIAHIWDDHEVENNYSDGNPAPAAAQRSAGYRAAFEWLPRMAYPSDRSRIYKRLSFGAMADVFLLDERQYRVAQGDDAQRTMLGSAQMGWLMDALARSTARWKIVAQQVVVAAEAFGTDKTNPDAWDGYADERAALLAGIEQRGITDVVFITGDAHVFLASLLASDFEALGDGSARRPAAVEFVGGSVTTRGRDLPEDRVRARSPWVQQYNGVDHGYSHLDLDGQRMVCEYRSSDEGSPNGRTTTIERFTQPAGENRFARERVAPVRRV